MVTRAQMARQNLEKLADNPYPGRGIVIGRTATDQVVQVYWVMGRSENSRNRVLERAGGDVVRTTPFDVSKVEDPSLIIYRAMDRVFNQYVVSNGDQTDTVTEHFQQGISPNVALRTRDYEPDEPNYTPRITGVTNAYTGSSLFWLTRRMDSGESMHTYFQDRSNEDVIRKKPVARAIGRCIHTYIGDGDPLPSFQGSPYLVPVGEGAEDTAQMYWDHLNPDNRVAIVARAIPLKFPGHENDVVDYHIINQLERPK